MARSSARPRWAVLKAAAHCSRSFPDRGIRFRTDGIFFVWIAPTVISAGAEAMFSNEPDPRARDTGMESLRRRRRINRGERGRSAGAVDNEGAARRVGEPQRQDFLVLGR